MIADLARRVERHGRQLGHTMRVAIDGITAAGKTTLADELGAALRAAGRDVQRLSMDGYHSL